MVKMASEEEMMRQMMGFSGFGNSISIFSLFVTKNIDTNLLFFHAMEKTSIWKTIFISRNKFPIDNVTFHTKKQCKQMNNLMGRLWPAHHTRIFHILNSKQTCYTRQNDWWHYFQSDELKNLLLVLELGIIFITNWWVR